MPTNEPGSSLSSIIAGDSLIVQEAQASPAAVGDTTTQQQNENQVATQEQTATVEQPIKDGRQLAAPATEKEEDSKAFVSGSRKARELGETRRTATKALLEIGTAGDYWQKEEVRKKLEEDSKLLDYVRKHFPKEHAILFEDKTGEEYEEDVDQIKKKAEIDVRAEVLAESIKAERREDAYDLAQRLAFTQTEADSLLRFAEKIEGEEIAGKKIEWEEALERAAHSIRPEKAKAGISSVGASQAPQVAKQPKINVDDDTLAWYAKRWGRKPEDLKANLQQVEESYKNGVFTLTA